MLENQTFSVHVNEEVYKVEFKVGSLPNDMKMLAFLCGELTNSAYYFTTFANVTKDDCNNIKKSFSLDGSKSWKPFQYEKRCSDAKKVIQKKKEISKKKLSVKNARNQITTFIGKQLKGRQEHYPLVSKFVNKAYCEPLHLKNNVVKERFLKILNVVVTESDIPASVKCFADVSESNLLSLFFDSLVKKTMNCNYLSKKLKQWFNENVKSINVSQFSFRFRGKESKNYLSSFPQVITVLFKKVKPSMKGRLAQIFYQS